MSFISFYVSCCCCWSVCFCVVAFIVVILYQLFVVARILLFMRCCLLLLLLLLLRCNKQHFFLIKCWLCHIKFEIHVTGLLFGLLEPYEILWFGLLVLLNMKENSIFWGLFWKNLHKKTIFNEILQFVPNLAIFWTWQPCNVMDNGHFSPPVLISLLCYKEYWNTFTPLLQNLEHKQQSKLSWNRFNAGLVIKP